MEVVSRSKIGWRHCQSWKSEFFGEKVLGVFLRVSFQVTCNRMIFFFLQFSHILKKKHTIFCTFVLLVLLQAFCAIWQTCRWLMESAAGETAKTVLEMLTRTRRVVMMSATLPGTDSGGMMKLTQLMATNRPEGTK